MYKWASRLLPLVLLLAMSATRTSAQPVSGNPRPITMKATSPETDSLVLVVIDGEIAGNLKEIGKNINMLVDPDRIGRVSVLKGDSAIARYGPKGGHGVIEILTKNSLAEKAVNSKGDTVEVIFQRVETEASFPGGTTAWREYLVRKLNADIPMQQYAPPGNYTVYVEFIVDRDGSISQIRPLSQHGYGMEEELIRVIRNGPAWVPAQQNGRKVKAFRRQPVTFVVIGEFELSAYKIPAGSASPVTVTTEAVKPADMEVTLSRGEAKQIGSSNTFLLNVDTPGDVLLTLWEKENKGRKEVGKVWVKVN